MIRDSDAARPPVSAPPTSSGPLFELRGVRQERGGRITLRDVDLEIPRGELVALVGPSGAGKTSLLRLLNRLDDPVAGEVRYAGRPIASVPVRELRRRVGFVFQTPVMFPGTVAENLALAARPPGPPKGASPKGASPNRASPNRGSPTPADVLPPVGLDETYAAREAARLSGGEQQRVSIARALTTRPEVLLLDEPTSALDPEVADTLMATVRRLAQEAGLGVVMVTHRLAEAYAASTYTIMLEGGRVVEAGATAVMFTAPAQARTRAYLLGRD